MIPEFKRLCVVCGQPIPKDRVHKRSITCGPEHQKQDRSAYRRYKRAKDEARLITSPKARTLVKSDADSVPERIERVDQ